MKPPATKQVHITDDGGQVDQSTVKVSKSAGQEVTWLGHNNKTAIVIFASPDGSPFHESVFHVPAAGSVSSGPAHPRAIEDKAYKYTVVGQIGVNDPEVIIEN
jgi:hypothetical protein